ncbi:hypothetical protein BDD12DRAFT_924964 [Trichophaea hybrida]|nr:hypothetical protein BDD12DRAFT_924964 [Trichophaea hybrida]
MNRRKATSPLITPDSPRYKRRLTATINSSPPSWPNEKFGEDQDTEMVGVEYEDEGVSTEPDSPNTVDPDPDLPGASYRALESGEPELPTTVESSDDSDPKLPDTIDRASEPSTPEWVGEEIEFSSEAGYTPKGGVSARKIFEQREVSPLALDAEEDGVAAGDNISGSGFSTPERSVDESENGAEVTGFMDASPAATCTFETPPPIPAAFTRSEVTPDPSLDRPLKHITNTQTLRLRPRPPPPTTLPGNIGVFLSLQPQLPKNITLSWNNTGTLLYIRDHDLVERKGTVVVRFHEGWVTYVGIVQNALALGGKKKGQEQEEEEDNGRSWWEKMRDLRRLLGLRVEELGRGLEGVFTE